MQHVLDFAKIANLLPWGTAKKIAGIIGPLESSRVVGGAVRNALLGHASQDIDIATTIPAVVAMERAKNAKLKVIPIGIDYGTIIVPHNSYTFEITTLRQDVKCFGRKAEIIFGNDWELDAQRRDFTINAIYLDFSGKIYDFHQGIADLQNKIIRFIGRPQERIQEDYLRILRFFRFIATLGVDANPDSDSLKSAIKCMPEIKVLSRERIESEMLKLLNQSAAAQTLMLIPPQHLAEYLGFLKIDIAKLKLLNPKSGSIIANLAAILRCCDCYDSAIDGIESTWLNNTKIIKALRKIPKTQEDINFLHANPLTHQRYKYKLGEELYLIYLGMITIIYGYNSELQQIVASTISLPRPKFPINVNDIVDLADQKAQRHKLISLAYQHWQENDFTPNKQDLLRFLNLHKFD